MMGEYRMRTRKERRYFLIALVSILLMVGPAKTAYATTDEPLIGEIRLFAFDFAPRGWTECNGQTFSIASNTALFSILGTTFGGNGQTNFAVPDLRHAVPYPAMKYYIATQGIYPSSEGDSGSWIGLTGEIFLYANNSAGNRFFSNGTGSLKCDGSSYPVSSYVTLCSVTGDTFGSSGGSLFTVPDLQKMAPGPNLSYYIAADGAYPGENTNGSDELIGSVHLFPYSFVPGGFTACDGSAFEINQNQALFSLAGTNYGGNGTTTFGIPDLTGAVPLPGIQYCMEISGIYPIRQ
jgi:microcystin-dependent protein